MPRNTRYQGFLKDYVQIIEDLSDAGMRADEIALELHHRIPRSRSGWGYEPDPSPAMVKYILRNGNKMYRERRLIKTKVDWQHWTPKRQYHEIESEYS
jgi:hypothetical protein